MMKAKTEEEKKKSLDLTWQELAQHNTKDDAWMAVRGQVYDVTSWLKSHPGGRDVLLLNAVSLGADLPTPKQTPLSYSSSSSSSSSRPPLPFRWDLGRN